MILAQYQRFISTKAGTRVEYKPPNHNISAIVFYYSFINLPKYFKQVNFDLPTVPLLRYNTAGQSIVRQNAKHPA